MREAPWGETVYGWLWFKSAHRRDSALWYSCMCVCVCGLYRHCCRSGVLFDRGGVYCETQKKRSVEMLMMSTSCSCACTSWECSRFLRISIGFLSKRCSLLRSQQPRWRGASNSFGWFVLMTHYFDVIASDSPLNACLWQKILFPCRLHGGTVSSVSHRRWF